jgi:hypothetical protein
MVKVIARGHRWHRMLCEGVYNTIKDLAATEKINASYVSRVMRLALLAPEIVEEILEGKQPAHLTMKDLMVPFPVEWDRQLAHILRQGRSWGRAKPLSAPEPTSKSVAHHEQAP